MTLHCTKLYLFTFVDFASSCHEWIVGGWGFDIASFAASQGTLPEPLVLLLVFAASDTSATLANVARLADKCTSSLITTKTGGA